MSKEIIATYEMLRQYRYTPSNYWLAISEFIDNSIGNYQNNNTNNDIDGLIINIRFDWRDRENRKIIIIDNAKGMSASRLEEAMQPCDRTNKSDTQYNQYGVGMKLGIFWYGENALIYSKQNNKESKLELITHNINLSQKVIVNAEPSNDNVIKYNSGTYIEISKIYDERNIIDQKNQLNLLKEALGWRYNKLIDKGLKIYIDVASDKNKTEPQTLIQPYFNKPFKLEQLTNNKKQSELTNKQRENEYIKRMNKLYEEKMKKNNFTPLFSEVWNKVINHEEVEVYKTIKVNNHDVQLKICIMDANRTNMAQYCGVTIYHMDRAIMHGPNKDQSGNFQFVQRSGASGDKARFRWLYGELNLTGIEQPDQNKSRFLWSASGEYDLKNELEQIYNELEELLVIISTISDVDSNKKLSESEANKISENMVNKVKYFKPIGTATDEQGNIGISGTCKIFNTNFEVRIFERDDINFLEIDVNDIENIFKIYIERENVFWKPFISKTEFKQELLYPIALYLGVSEWIIDNEDKKNQIKKYENKRFLEILSTIVKDYSNNG